MGKHLLKLGLYLSKLRHAEYVWGQTDCNLFVADWVDTIYNTNTAGEIRGKYSDAVSAVRFARHYTQAPDWLADQGYTQCDCTDAHQYESGDILLQHPGAYYVAWIVLMGMAYSMTAESGLVAVPAHKLTDYTHWRNTK